MLSLSSRTHKCHEPSATFGNSKPANEIFEAISGMEKMHGVLLIFPFCGSPFACAQDADLQKTGNI